MAKFELEVEHDYDFDLIGVACHVPDYRFCWSLNRALDINLERIGRELQTLHKDKSTKGRFPLFYHRNDDSQAEYTLIVNKHEGSYLLSEIKQADYLFMLKGLSRLEVKNISNALLKENFVLTAFPVNIEQLKFKEILLF